MELLDGQSPPQFIRRQGRLPPGQAATIGVAVVSALFAAHAVGITHRDLIFGRVMTPTDEPSGAAPGIGGAGGARGQLLRDTSGGSTPAGRCRSMITRIGDRRSMVNASSTCQQAWPPPPIGNSSARCPRSANQSPRRHWLVIGAGGCAAHQCLSVPGFRGLRVAAAVLSGAVPW
ncbi:MAG TPA: hypothetical protein VII33_19600 [Nakamurella sp.]